MLKIRKYQSRAAHLNDPDIRLALMENDFHEGFLRQSVKLEKKLSQLKCLFTEHIRAVFCDLIDEYSENTRAITTWVREQLKSDFSKPKIEIHKGDKATHVLRTINIQDVLDGNRRIVVFQLPLPLAHFWWKGGTNSWGGMGIELGDGVINWGDMYRNLMYSVWEKLEEYEKELGLSFERLNLVGEHDPNNFYYIWEVSEM